MRLRAKKKQLAARLVKLVVLYGESNKIRPERRTLFIHNRCQSANLIVRLVLSRRPVEIRTGPLALTIH